MEVDQGKINELANVLFRNLGGITSVNGRIVAGMIKRIAHLECKAQEFEELAQSRWNDLQAIRNILDGDQ